MTVPKSVNQCEIAIVGGGIAGLTIAWQCLQHFPEKRVVLFEKQRIGGQCVSFENRGTWFDVGGHFFHNLDKLPKEFQAYAERCESYQKNTYSIDVNSKIYHGMIQNFYTFTPGKIKRGNLEEYFISSFGKEVYNIFLRDYNQKLHVLPLNQCGVPSLASARSPAKGAGSYNSSFLYPKTGGAEDFVKWLFAKVRDHIEIVFDECLDFDAIERNICTRSGAIWKYSDALFHSGSIAEYLELAPHSPQVWIMNGYGKPRRAFEHIANSPCWCYVATPHTPVFRLGNYAICGGEPYDGMMPFYLESCRPFDESVLTEFFERHIRVNEFHVPCAYPVSLIGGSGKKDAEIKRAASLRCFWIGRYGKDQWFSMSETIADTLQIFEIYKKGM